MKSRAAVAFAAGEPLQIVEIDVAPPKAGEVLVKITHTGVCHTDAFTLSRRRSGRAVSLRCSATRARASWSKSARASPASSRATTSSRCTPPNAAQCLFCKSGKTNLCVAVRATQGKGVMPDGTTRFSYNGQPIYHYMGCSTFSEYTVVAEVSLAKINPEANHEHVCLLGCGVTTGHRCRAQHGEGAARRFAWRCSAWAASAWR